MAKAAVADAAIAMANASLFAEAERYIKELQELEDYCFDASKDAEMKKMSAAAISSVDRAVCASRDRVDQQQQLGSSSGADEEQRNAKVMSLYLKGRAMSFVSEQNRAAEAMLLKAVKLDPKLLGAWNALGEAYWNLQNFEKAKESFEHAIEHCGENSVSLRNLSMVLRAIDRNSTGEDGAARRSANFAAALEKAKAAVALDARDSHNWETLGNAYMGDFFVNARAPEEISKALIAYQRAEAACDKLGRCNPTLQLNRGMAAKYIEDYALALRSFRKAHEIGAAGALEEVRKVLELVERLAGYAERRGDAQAKRPWTKRELAVDIPKGPQNRSLRDLRTGENTAAPLVAKVVAVIDRKEEMPVILVCSDSGGNLFALSLYNADLAKVSAAVIPMNSILRIHGPKLLQITVPAVDCGKAGGSWTYPCVRVAEPSNVDVNSKGSLRDAAVRSVFSVGAERVEARQATSKEADKKKEIELIKEAESEKHTPLESKLEKWAEQEDAKAKEAVDKARAAERAKAKAAKEQKARSKLKGKDKLRCKAKRKDEFVAATEQEKGDEQESASDSENDAEDSEEINSPVQQIDSTHQGTILAKDVADALRLDLEADQLGNTSCSDGEDKKDTDGLSSRRGSTTVDCGSTDITGFNSDTEEKPIRSSGHPADAEMLIFKDVGKNETSAWAQHGLSKTDAGLAWVLTEQPQPKQQQQPQQQQQQQQQQPIASSFTASPRMRWADLDEFSDEDF
jgi:tetratricopeptide (TPR) repeat protein